ncbi:MULTISPECIES: hypothetical protein [Photorhabdus]|nr:MULTISPECIES: hypothetical protein [Photorhabdus]
MTYSDQSGNRMVLFWVTLSIGDLFSQSSIETRNVLRGRLTI